MSFIYFRILSSCLISQYLPNYRHIFYTTYKISYWQITENTEYGYQTPNLEMAGSQAQSYQVQSMLNPVSTDHINHNIPDMGSLEIGNEGYQDQNMGITGIADYGCQTQNVGTYQGDQVQNMINEL